LFSVVCTGVRLLPSMVPVRTVSPRFSKSHDVVYLLVVDVLEDAGALALVAVPSRSRVES
jgi:hypothetical protein